MKIHSIFVLKKGGVPIYHKYFSDDKMQTEIALISSFFTAILDFSRAVVKEDLDVMDIGNLRFFFKVHDSGNLIFVVMTSHNVSVLLIKERLKLIMKAFFKIANYHSCLETDCIIENKALDEKLETIVYLHDSYSESEIEPIKQEFEVEKDAGEIEAGALFTTKGEIYYSSLPNDFLHQALREVEIRAQSDTKTLKIKLPRLIWRAGDSMICSQVIYSNKYQQLLVVSLLFDAVKTNLGMADFELEKIVSSIKQHLD